VGRTDAGLEEEEEVGMTSLTEFLREECVTLYGSYLREVLAFLDLRDVELVLESLVLRCPWLDEDNLDEEDSCCASGYSL